MKNTLNFLFLLLISSTAWALSTAATPGTYVILDFAADQTQLTQEHIRRLDSAFVQMRTCGEDWAQRSWVRVESTSKAFPARPEDYQRMGERGEAVYRYVEKLNPKRSLLTIEIAGNWTPEIPQVPGDYHVSVRMLCSL